MDRIIIDEKGMDRTITRLSHEILEKNKGLDNIVIIGIKTRGEFLARRIIEKIKEIDMGEPAYGVLDATLYRDDYMTRLKQPQIGVTDITCDINGKDVILIDDVLYTGRTIRSSLDAIIDIGRPQTIQLCVLLDRGHRELPIAPDFVGKNIPTSMGQEVRVRMKEIDGEDSVYLIDAKN